VPQAYRRNWNKTNLEERIMRTLVKIAAALGVISAIAVGSAVPAAAWYGYYSHPYYHHYYGYYPYYQRHYYAYYPYYHHYWHRWHRWY
jgi:hypothetical protein